MDPNTTLSRLRENAKAALEFAHADDEMTLSRGGDLEDYLIEVAEAFESLDRWIVSGGFLPADWKR